MRDRVILMCFVFFCTGDEVTSGKSFNLVLISFTKSVLIWDKADVEEEFSF